MIICGASPANRWSRCSTQDKHAAVEGRTDHHLELHHCSSDLLPLDLSKILMNFWTIKILFPGKKSSTAVFRCYFQSCLNQPSHLRFGFGHSKRCSSLLTQLSSNDPSAGAENRALRNAPCRTAAERHEQSRGRTPQNRHACFRATFYILNFWLKVRTPGERQKYTSWNQQDTNNNHFGNRIFKQWNNSVVTSSTHRKGTCPSNWLRA